ncbi:MAG: hypothetical protein ACXWGW_15275 [Methylobacter sp.]
MPAAQVVARMQRSGIRDERHDEALDFAMLHPGTRCPGNLCIRSKFSETRKQKIKHDKMRIGCCRRMRRIVRD